MSVWVAAAVVVLIGALGPAVWIGCHGRVEERLVGLQLVAATATLLLVLLAVAFGQSSMLIVPLTLAVMAPVGTLVFTRMLAPHASSDRPVDAKGPS